MREFAFALGVAWCAAGGLGAMARAQDEARQSAPDGDEERDRVALERFTSLLEKTPRKGTALDRVYGYHVERGTIEALVKGYEARVEKDPNDGVSWLILGMIESLRGRDAAAVQALEKAEAARPTDPLPAYYAGQALVLVGQPEAAAAAFERALERKPNRTDVLEIFQALGRVYQRAQKNEQAMGVWTRLEALFPDDARVQEQIADALADEGDAEAALPRFEALSKKMKDPFRQVQLAIDAAELKVRLGRTDEALKDFESQLSKLRPESWLHREVRHKIEDVFLRTDDQAGLAAYYERWIAKNPEDIEAFTLLGRTLANSGRAADARGWYDKAVKRAPSRRDLRLALIGLLEQDKKFAEASAQYEELDQQSPGNPDTLRDWGALLLRDTTRPEAERRTAAAAVWRKLLDGHENDAVTTAQVADLLRRAELVDDALALYRRAIELAPGNPQYREYLGEYFHTLKRSDEALAAWSAIAAGDNRDAKNLARLSEVYAGFGYLKEAIPPLDEAVKLEGDDFGLRLKFAEILHRAERYDDATAQLAAAEKLAEDEEERAAVLEAQVKNDQIAGTLETRIATLSQAVAGAPASMDNAVRLARYLEAAGRVPQAIETIEKATTNDARSVAAQMLLARLRESSGQLADAATAYTRLTEIDRRNRTEYLSNIAKLEARLGRVDKALSAGRDLIAAAPGNPDHYEFFANLCFQLGRDDEGLDTLRRAVRVNPNDTKVLLSLAETLAGLFRTEEAIETYWRAFEKEQKLDARVGMMSRLTELYLQRNQLDRLLSRLQREQNEAKNDQQKRELGICAAQVYVTSGDLGMGRSELERLLASNERDTQLLQQLSKLAEDEGDLETAAKHQQQLNELAPSEDGTLRLAQLHMRAGDLNEAQAIWTSMAGGEGEAHRALQAIDSLLANDKPQSVLDVTETLLRKNPADWEALYRQGQALAQLGKRDDAVSRFQALLDLKVGDDEQSALAKSRARGPVSAGMQPTNAPRRQPLPVEARVSAAQSIRLATKLEIQPYYYSQRALPNAWAPIDYGQARMAALAWQLALARETGKTAEDEFIAKVRSGKEKTPADLDALWTWFYFCCVRNEYAERLEAARALNKAQSDVPSAIAFLGALQTRLAGSGGQTYAPGNVGDISDTTPPLDAADIAQMLECFKLLRQRAPDRINGSLVTLVSSELKRAKETEAADSLYQDLLASASQAETIEAVLPLAAQRGDVMQLLALADKLEQTREGSSAQRAAFAFSAANTLAQCMAQRADAKHYDDVLRILDRQLNAAIRQFEQPGASSRSRSRPSAMPARGQFGLQVWTGSTQRYIQLTFPAPNQYYDVGALSVLRNAYELYKKDDLLSDLLTHLAARADVAQTPTETLFSRLALAYVYWWDEQRAEAIVEFTKAVESSSADSDLRLMLATLLEQSGESSDALELVDEVKPLDNVTTQKREEQAMRLAVLNGDLGRARLAAERLFGLRLDAEAQMRLSGQMHQLGMHEMAESVLARARRRAGGKASALVGLMLQYQRQDRADIAEQIALQILRTTTASRAAGGAQYIYSGGNESDSARAAAVQVLAQSGKLETLIARVNEQLARTPNSVALRQALADYYTAAGQADKAQAEYLKLAELRPDDANLRFNIGSQLQSAGKPAEAVEHFKIALKKSPALLMNNYWNIQNAFREANKYDELVDLVDQIDLRSIGQPYYLMNLLQMFLNDEKLADRASGLFKKAWDALPQERPQLLAYLQGDALSRIPDVYELVRDVVVPDRKSYSPATQWNVFQSSYSWDAQGRLQTPVDRVLELAENQGRLSELAAQAETARKELPNWTAGAMVEAMIACRAGDLQKARSLASELVKSEPEKAKIPGMCLWALGGALEDFSDLKDIAIAAYERALADADTTNSVGRNYEYSPARRLVDIYRADGRDDEARRVLKAFTTPKESPQGYPEEWLKQMRIGALTSAAAEMSKMGNTADAIPLYGEAANLAESISADSAQYGDNRESWLQQIHAGMTQAFTSVDDEHLGNSLSALVSSGADADADKGKSKPNEARSPVNLVMLISPTDLENAKLRSLFAESVAACAKSPATLAKINEALSAALAAHPDDPSVHVAACLVTLGGTDEKKSSAAAVDSLLALIKRAPLETLAEGARANARQRADAFRFLPVWLVARACWEKPELQARGDVLAEFALEAAARQTEPNWLLAMQRERGEVALKRGDRAAAEAAWAAMLERVLLRDQKPKTTAQEKAMLVPLTPAAPASISVPARVRPVPMALVRGVIRWQAPKNQAEYARQKAVGVANAATPAADGNVPMQTLDRYEKAMQIAKLAASNGLHELSFRAVREAHAGGPPIQLVNDESNGQQVMISRGTSGPNGDTVIPRVAALLAELDALWLRQKAPADGVYETLRDVVAPPARPTEVFLYTTPVDYNNLSTTPQSGAAVLVGWARRANKADDLLATLRSRGAAAAMASQVVDARLALENKNYDAANAALRGLAAQLENDKLRTTAELASHAALPAFRLPETRVAALAILDASFKTLDNSDSDGSSSQLLLTIARECINAKDLPEARKRLDAYLAAVDRMAARQQGDYGVYYRKDALNNAALEYARGGLVAECLDLLGRFSDAPAYSQGDPSTAAALERVLRQLSTIPADERYETLLAWTMPTPARRSIRMLSGLNPGLESDSSDQEADRLRTPVISSAAALVHAARDAGKLDAFAAEVQKLATEKLAHADDIAALIAVEQGKNAEVLPRLQAAIDALVKRSEPVAAPPAQQLQAGYSRDMPQSPAPYPFVDHLIVTRAIERDDPALRPLAVRAAQLLIDTALNTNVTSLTNPLKESIALARVRRAGSTVVQSQRDANLQLWHPASSSNATRTPGATAVHVPPWWVSHQGYVAKVTGGTNGILLFDLPLGGSYEFSVDVYGEGSYGPAMAHMGSFIRPFNPSGAASLVGFGNRDEIGANWPGRRTNAFARLTAQVTPEKIRYLVNGELLYEEKEPSPTAPWVGLAPWSHYVSVLRNPTITGNPTVPEVVPLCVADRLEGWTASLFDESWPLRRSEPPDQTNVHLRRRRVGGRIVATTAAVRSVKREPVKPEDYDWCARDGIILGRRGSGPSVTPAQAEANPAFPTTYGLLGYYRPLKDGDVLTYEFFYNPDETMVHPAIDDFAILLETDGPRVVPLSAHRTAEDGPRVEKGAGAGIGASLKTQDWNRLTIKVSGSKLALDLNGQAIGACELPAHADRQFGLFHDRALTSVQVRDINLRGAWPKQLDESIRTNLLAQRPGTVDSEADTRARHLLIGDEFFGASAAEILQAADKLEGSARLEALERWVLPGPDHDSIRLYGEFLPVDPFVRAPALELVKAADAAGSLDALQARVAAIETQQDADAERSKAALLAIIASARGDAAALDEGLKRLVELLGTVTPVSGELRYWPETVAASAVVARGRSANTLLDALLPTVFKRASDSVWETQLLDLEARARLAQLNASPALDAQLGTTPDAGLWHVIVPPLPRWSNAILPGARWTVSNGTIQHHSGLSQEMLGFAIPVGGDFELTCEVTRGERKEVGLIYARSGIWANADGKGITRYDTAGQRTESPLAKSMEAKAEWVPYKLAVKNRLVRTFIDGQQVDSHSIAADEEPWLGVVAPARSTGAVRNMKISGTPTIASELKLAATPNLSGWNTTESGETFGMQDADWQRRGREILARRRVPTDTRPPASLLRYNRSLLVGDSIAYEFFYDPEHAVIVHPSLSDTAYLVSPTAVEARPLDALFAAPDSETTAPAPEDAAAEPKIPLKSKEWNTLVISRAPDKVTLTLNGATIVEQPMDASKPLAFGFCRNPREDESRIRNVTLKGHWPTSLPDDLIPTTKP